MSNSKAKRKRPKTGHGDPWLILPEEPVRAYEAFKFFLELPVAVRTQQAVATAFESSSGTISQWSKEWIWTERLEAWTRHVGKIAATKRAETLSEIRVKEVDIAHNTLKLVTIEVAKYLRIALSTQDPTLSPSQLTKLADFGVRLGRLLQGEPETIIEERITIDTTEERKLLLQVIDKPELVNALGQALEGYDTAATAVSTT